MNVVRFRVSLAALLTLTMPLADSAQADESTSDSGKKLSQPISLPGGVKLEAVDFERHVMGVVGRMGCNGGSCHGSFQGRGGFRLSLFSYDFDMDYEAINDRVDVDDPDASYLLEKPTLTTEHGGGKRFDKNSWQYKVIREWIAAGAQRKPGSGNVAAIQTVPRVIRFAAPGQSSQLKVLATYADGSRENVTTFCDFRINDDYVAELSPGGMLKALRPGDTAVVVQYRGHVMAAQALVPAAVEQGFVYPKATEFNYVDREVSLKLRQLNIVPSQLSSDLEFLRRVSIDTIGRLPALDEVRAFLADPNLQKRSKKINELLDDPLHAALWATKLSDITGNNSDALDQPRTKRSQMWHDWFRRRLERNAGYDEIVRGVLSATSREEKNPQEWVRQATAIDEAALVGFETDYADRESLDLFWMRRGLNLEQMGEQTAAAFMGVRLQCSRCHKHPYDRWTQADYRSFANVFGQVKVGASAEARAAVEAENQRREGEQNKLARLREVFVDVNNPRRLNDPKTNRPLPAKAPGGPELDPSADTRQALFDWLRQSDNPFFARSFVNRVWQHYFGVGIVDPVDDFSVGNPPSNAQLLDRLADDFVKHNYDIRHIERTVLNSRTYQLSSQPNETNIHDRRNFARSYPRRMMAEVVVDVINSALGTRDVYSRDAPEGSRAIEVAGTRVRDGNLRYAFRIFGRPNRSTACDCERSAEPSLRQTLYFMTDDLVMRKIRNGRLRQLVSQGNRLQRLQNKTMPFQVLQDMLDEISLATLTRLPTPAERRRAIEHVLRKENSYEGLVDVVWAMLNTREFVLNH